MKGRPIKTFEAGRYSFEVWEGADARGPCYVTVVRALQRKEQRGPLLQRRRIESLIEAMQEATMLASRLQERADQRAATQQKASAPHPSPAASPLPPSPSDFGCPNSAADGGSLASERLPPPGLRVLQREESMPESFMYMEKKP